MPVEDLTKSLIRNYQSESDAFFDIADCLSHIEEPDSIINVCIELAWQRHTALENLIANLKWDKIPQELFVKDENDD